GLPGLTPELTRNFRDKIVMKNKVRAAGLRVPDYVSCTDRDAVEALLAKHDRIVIKAVDGQGSREVTFVNSKDELDAWFATPNPYFENFEAEEFIDGILYHVNSIVHNGESILVASAPYLPNMGNIDFTEGTPFVSVLVTEGDLKARLEDFSQKALTALGLQNGVTHFECFVKSNGEIVFCETAVRPGGGGIVLMIEGQYGVNYNRAGILLEAGRGDLIKIEDRPNEVLGLMGIRQAFAGTVKKAPTSNLFGEEWIRHARIDAEVGNYVPSASHCTDFLGVFIFSSPSRNDFDTRREELYSRFYSSLEIQPGA
ncbi:MAG: ATP-grasp domain-containing protein, partial [Myxococcota bacterium]